MGFGNASDTVSGTIGVQFPVLMRADPTFTASAAGTFLMQSYNNNSSPTSVTMQVASTIMASVAFSGTVSLGAGGVGVKMLGTNASLSFSSEL